MAKHKNSMSDKKGRPSSSAAQGGVMRQYFLSKSFIYSAAFFARMSHKIEQDIAHGQALNESLFLEHRGFVIGAVFTSSAFLEAGIKEIYANNANGFSITNAPDHFREAMGWLSEDMRASFTAIWGMLPFRENFSLLGKYALALRLANVHANPRRANTHANPLKEMKSYKDILLLIDLRNELIHYKAAEIIDGISSGEKTQKLERELGRKFQNNPMFVGTRHSPTVFPEKLLHHACARWAVVSSLEFMDAFCQLIGIPPRRHELDILKPDWIDEQQVYAPDPRNA